MTDRELIEALRCCGNDDVDGCKNCPVEKECLVVAVGIPVATTAADRLEALLAENERLKAQLPKWVSVEERLPEENIDVLTLVDGKYKNISFARAPMICAWFGNEGWFCNEYPEWDNPGVTHWMPLPEEAKVDG